MRRTLLLSSTLLAVLLSAPSAHAGWPFDGILIDDVITDGFGASAFASDRSGGVYHGFRQAGETWLGHLGPDGAQLPGFPVRLGPLLSLKLIPDGSGGAFACQIADSVGERKLTVSRIRSTGVSAWPARLVVGNDSYATAADGAAGDLFQGWEERRGDGHDHHVVIARVDSSGQFASGWPIDIPRSASSRDWFFQLVGDEEGGVLVAIHGDSLTTMRFDRDGQQLWLRSEGPLQLLDIFHPHILSDGMGGTYVGWSPPGDWTAPNFARQIRLLHVARSGDPWPGWSDTGIVLNDPVFSTSNNDPALVTDGHGGLFVVYEVEGGGRHSNIFCQRVNADGTIAAGWPRQGSVVVEGGNDQTDIAATSDGAGGVLVAWRDRRDEVHGPGAVPYAQRLDANGQRAPGWPEGGVRLSGTSDGELPSVVSDGNRGAFIGWRLFGGPGGIQRVRGDGVYGPLLSGPPTRLRASLPFPNPSQGIVFCDVQVATGDRIVADIHDISGRRIASLINDASVGSGSHRYRWDGLDEKGRPAKAGIYFLILRTPTEVRTTRFAVVR